MFRKIEHHQRFTIKGKLLIVYNERGKLAYQSVLGNRRYVSLFNYPKTLRTYHLWLLGIFFPKTQHKPYLNL